MDTKRFAYRYGLALIFLAALLVSGVVVLQRSSITGFATGELTDNAGIVVATKIVDDPSFETRFVSIERTRKQWKTGSLILIRG